MKKRKKLNGILATILAVVLMFSSAVPVFAADGTDESQDESIGVTTSSINVQYLDSQDDNISAAKVYHYETNKAIDITEFVTDVFGYQFNELNATGGVYDETNSTFTPTESTSEIVIKYNKIKTSYTSDLSFSKEIMRDNESNVVTYNIEQNEENAFDKSVVANISVNEGLQIRSSSIRVSGIENYTISESTDSKIVVNFSEIKGIENIQITFSVATSSEYNGSTCNVNTTISNNEGYTLNNTGFIEVNSPSITVENSSKNTFYRIGQMAEYETIIKQTEKNSVANDIYFNVKTNYGEIDKNSIQAYLNDEKIDVTLTEDDTFGGLRVSFNKNLSSDDEIRVLYKSSIVESKLEDISTPMLFTYTSGSNTPDNGNTVNTVLNIKDSTKIAVNVLDKNEKLLNGVTFKISNEDESYIKTFTTGDDNYSEFYQFYDEKLAEGDYTITITDVPSGYIIPADTSKLVLSNDIDDVQVLTISLDFTQVSINVLSELTGNNLFNTFVTLLDENGDEVDVSEYVNSSFNNGFFTNQNIEALPEGNYFIHFRTVMTGYVIPEDISFSVSSSNPKVSVDAYIVATSVSISAVDRDSLNAIENDTVVSLFDSNNEIVTVGGETQFKLPMTFYELPMGDYTVKTISVPAGYVLPEDYLITVEELSNLQNIIHFYDKTTVSIAAIDSNNDAFNDLDIDILDSNNNVLDLSLFTSESESELTLPLVLSALPIGDYTINIKNVKEGYFVENDSVKLTVENTEDVQAIILNIKNTSAEFSVLLNGLIYEGVECHIENEKGDILYTFTSEKESFKVNAIPTGKYVLVIDTFPMENVIVSPSSYEFTIEETTELQSFVLDVTVNLLERYSSDNNNLPSDTSPDTGDISNALLFEISSFVLVCGISFLVFLTLNKVKKQKKAKNF